MASGLSRYGGARIGHAGHLTLADGRFSHRTTVGTGRERYAGDDSFEESLAVAMRGGLPSHIVSKYPTKVFGTRGRPG